MKTWAKNHLPMSKPFTPGHVIRLQIGGGEQKGALAVRFIKLGGKREGLAFVDDSDFDRLCGYNYSMNSRGYVQRAARKSSGERTIALLHRDVLGLLTGDDQIVDHIDGDRLNNTRANLRICENHENCANRNPSGRNTSGYKGVNRHKQTGKWRAYIKVNYKQIALGCYSSPEIAAAAYNFAAIDYYGEFARLNTLPDGVSFTREHITELRHEYDRRQQTPAYRETIRQAVSRRWQTRKQEGHKHL